MTKVGFVTTSLTTGHAVRGVGVYTHHLLQNLRQLSQNSQVEIVEIKLAGSRLPSDLNLIHYPYFDLFFHSLPIWPPLPTVVTIHDVIPLEFPAHYPPGLRGWFNFQLQKLALANVSRVITDSSASIQALRKYLRIPHEKMKLVYLAADSTYRPVHNPQTLGRIKRKYHLPDKFVLYVGDINYNKNIPSLVRVCRALNTPLVIVGQQASEVEHLDLSHPELVHLQESKPLIIHDSLRLGFVPVSDLVAIYNLATVYCQPSFAEGFGLPILEALACGTPVACSNTHSLPELAGSAALYFDPYNSSQIQEVLNQLLNDSRPRAKSARLGPRQSSKFSWAKTASDTIMVYQELI